MQKLNRSKQFIRLMITGSLVIGMSALLPEDAVARGGGFHDGGARTHVNSAGNMNINRNVNTNANINRNVNANVNVNRNVNVHGGYRGGYYYDDHHHGVSTGAAVAIGVAGLAVGTMIGASQLPPSCSIVSVNGISYQQCGSSWYQPQYSGSQVTYVVVNPPR